MKTIKVGSWFNKLNKKEQEYFCKKQERFGTQLLRSYLSAARKQFKEQDSIQYLDSLNLSYNGETYWYSSDWNKFFKMASHRQN